ncbi:MAG: hypothetical protein OJJ54_23230 [Pseudonocardia sp.]|nr:hypothetical protein [Pseudonocardia sp.]
MNEFVKHAPADRLPTLIRTPQGYRVFDPALVAGSHYQIDERGTLVYTRLPAGSVALTVVVLAAVAGVALGDDWLTIAGWLAAGLVVGTALAGAVLSVIHSVSSPERRYRRLYGDVPFTRDVTDRGTRAWQLCEQAERLAATRSWITGAVDSARSLPALVWAGAAGEEWATEAVDRLVNPTTGPNLHAPA